MESGDTQSPIDIETTKTQEMKDNGAIELNYNNAVLVAEDKGHSIQLDVTGTAKINGRLFDLTQFHIHAPSEHELDGKHHPIEVLRRTSSCYWCVLQRRRRKPWIQKSD
ncbi:carbonic anhydrase family protein [Peribacillus muralis]|uniref:carbonic anhydrase family protein n=1 Tax=Peribacillus muralis TaxID=264697 RepID=UPI003D05C410